MRVISGTVRGCVLVAPDGLLTRPTADRIKESLFNIIQAELQDICFLDLFAGSGAIGIEALSRGAARSVFVDNSRESINSINNNLKKTRLVGNADVLQMDILQAIDYLAIKGQIFDIIYIDPPYKKGLVETTLKAIINGKILSADGIIIVEQGSDEPLPQVFGLTVYREKKYSATKIVFLQNQEAPSAASPQNMEW